MNNTSNQKLDVICILFSEFHIEIGFSEDIKFDSPQSESLLYPISAEHGWQLYSGLSGVLGKHSLQ